jgi:hypothetical protein
MKKIVSVLSAASLAVLILGATSVAAKDHTLPGIPGTKTCKGETTAYLAQAAKNGLIDDAFHGIGGIGEYASLSVKEVQQVIDDYCAQ